MFLCDKNHEEICHESRTCPLCEANTKINDVLAENEQLRMKLDAAGFDSGACGLCGGKDKHCKICQ